MTASIALCEACELLIDARGALHQPVPGLEIALLNVFAKTKRLHALLPTTEVVEPHPKVESLWLFSTKGWDDEP